MSLEGAEYSIEMGLERETTSRYSQDREGLIITLACLCIDCREYDL